MKLKRLCALFICVMVMTVMVPFAAAAEDQPETDDHPWGDSEWTLGEARRASDRAYAPDRGDSDFLRLAGKNRYETSIMVADQWMAFNDGYPFSNVIIASGADFPDALGSSGPAYELYAPIILVDKSNVKKTAEYVYKNMESDGLVYIMGGEGAVPKTMETELNKVGIGSERIIRFAGRNRYETNIKVLKGYDSIDSVIVCSGKNYADALSASALGAPILLVGDALTEAQIDFLVEYGIIRFLIVGGPAAVSEEVEDQLIGILADSTGSGGFLYRISGNNRYETSKNFAYFIWDACDAAVLASGNNFPDGLSGCTLCFWEDCPLLLATNKATEEAAECAQSLGADHAIVLGGETLISDAAVKHILGLDK